jgi:DNA-directed RNA polymerase subunit H (RpoH/RPB5)
MEQLGRQDKIDRVKENVRKMLSNRIAVNDKGEKIPLVPSNQTIETVDDVTFYLKTATGKYYVKILFLDITSIKKQAEVMEFIDNYSKHNKILIATSFTKAAMNSAHDYNTLEIFTVTQLMVDIISFCLQPQMEVLSETEKKIFLEERSLEQPSLTIMMFDDPVRHYFNLKVGDIIRCIRVNPQSGKTPYYRIVVATHTPKKIFVK